MASSYLRTLWRPTLFHRPAPSSGATKLPPAASRTGRRVAVSLTAALASGLALILAARPLAAQGQSELQQPTFRISVDRIEIGAVVTDSKGHHITNLRIEEFTLLDGGKLQQLTHCEYVRSPTPTALPSASPWKAASELPTVIPPALSRQQVDRGIVYLVDDESFASEVVPAVRRAIKSTVEQDLHAGDLVALIRTSSGNGVLEQFTTDRRVLLASCNSIRWRPESRGNPGMLPQVSGRIVGEGSSGYLVGRSMDRTATVMRYVISALRDLPGRKAIVLVSQSFPFGLNYANPATRVANDVGKLVDLALRASVVVYSIDPTALSSLTPGADYDLTRDYTAQFGAGGSMSNQTAMALPRIYTDRALALLEFSRSGLRALAEGTGGMMAADTDPTVGLGRFVDDLQGYYLLTYKPQEPERYFAAKKGQPPPFHTVRIRVKRPGVHVRSYAGYIAKADSAEPAASAHGEISKALFSPFSAAGIRVALTSVFTQPAPGSPELSLLLHIDARDLSFTTGNDGLHHAGFELVARTMDERDDPAQVVTKQAALQLEEGSFQEATQMGVAYRVSVPAQRSGLYEVRVAIRDNASGKLGSARGVRRSAGSEERASRAFRGVGIPRQPSAGGCGRARPTGDAVVPAR